jgi:hypothetical protein
VRRPLVLLLAFLAFAAVTACGDDEGDGGKGDGGEVQTTPVEFGAGDEVWLRVSTGGGFVPYIVNLREVPQLLLFDDGRLVRLVEHEDGLGPVVPELEVVQLDEDGAADLLDTFAAVVDGPDPGQAPVTDLSTTTIELTTGGRTRDLGIYALGFEDGLSDSEVQARRAAQAAIDEAQGLDGAQPYVPEEWFVLTTFSETAPAIDLPLDPERVASADTPAVCTRITGDEVQPVLDAANAADPAVEIVLRPILTGDETCNLSGSDPFVER